MAIRVHNGKKYYSIKAFLEAVFNEPAGAFLERKYLGEKMSVAEITEWLKAHLNIKITERQIARVMSEYGTKMRTVSEFKRLNWEQGKMDGSIAKSRQSQKKAYMVGSKAEQTVRYLLREALLALDIKWDVVIGDNLQHILARYEVDIPVVVVDKTTRLACRYAIEVDNSFTHSGSSRIERDRLKDLALQNTGWTVFRLDGGVKRKEELLEQIADLALAIEAHTEKAFASKSITPDCAIRISHGKSTIDVFKISGEG